MLPTNNPKFDRTLFACCLASMWILPSIFIYAFLHSSHLPWWWNGIGLACAVLLYLCAFVVTFVVGGLRYVLTGSEFPND